MPEGRGPVILDVCSIEQRRDGWIQGALFVSTLVDSALDPLTEVVPYCDCPNEGSAAVWVRELMRRGFRRVRPLAGGSSHGRTAVTA